MPLHRGDGTQNYLFETAKGNESILPVDDDPATRYIVTMILQTLGYPVMEAASATKAIALAERHLGEFHLLIINVIMP